METIRICLVGAGRAGMVHAFNFRHRIGGVRLAAVVDADQALAHRRADELDVPHAFGSIEAALSQASFDAVCIATPTFTHAAVATAAAQAGKHILCEKPMARTLDEVNRLYGGGGCVMLQA